MTMTNEERREVARRLRELEQGVIGALIPTGELAENILRAIDYGRSGAMTPYGCLADLIDPDRDLTCELEPTASERTDAPVRVYECDCCGRSCDAVYAEDYVYCPYCGRLNTAREVEVEE